MSPHTIGRALIACLAILACVAPQTQARPGSPDRPFGKDGIVRCDADPSGEIVSSDVALDGRGRIVVLTRSRDDRSVLLRFRGDGSPDRSFGGGIGRIPIADGPWNGLAVQADDGIVIAGSSAQDFALMRFKADGSPDPSFDGDGLMKLHLDSPLPVSPEGLHEAFRQVVLRPDGRMVALGAFERCSPESCLEAATVIAGYRPDGSLDHSSATRTTCSAVRTAARSTAR